jgi:very-short-patch-repair endonuclease
MRDGRQRAELEHRGWVVIRFWEHELHTNLGRCVRMVQESVAVRIGSEDRDGGT